MSLEVMHLRKCATHLHYLQICLFYMHWQTVQFSVWRLPVWPPVAFTSLWHEWRHQPSSSLICLSMEQMVWKIRWPLPDPVLSLHTFWNLPFYYFVSRFSIFTPFLTHYAAACQDFPPPQPLNEARLQGDVEAMIYSLGTSGSAPTDTHPNYSAPRTSLSVVCL